ncbi:MAG: PAS domain-containing protein [Candidatus Tantalella remota]|nr:PAS domain-containing protein [Candidatus Tantalella remota]
MILVKRKHLYILTLLFCILLIFGEVKFFYALNKLNLEGNLDLKYEVENFIFAAVCLFLIVFLFLVNFMRMSRNILRKLDKIIELSEYGRLDISEHLKEIGPIGDRVRYLIHQLEKMNRMKSLKISSLSGINSFLVKRAAETLFYFDYKGNILDCSETFIKKFKINREEMTGKNVSGLFKTLVPSALFCELEKKRSALVKDNEKITVRNEDKSVEVTLYPVMNADNEVSHAVAVIG